MSDEAMDTGAALMELAAGRRNPIKKSSRRFDQADLGAYLLAMIHGLFTDPAQLNKSEGGKLIIIEQFMDDPELTDLLLAAMRGKREFLDIMNVFSLVFEPPSPNRDKVDAREMPAVFNFIPWRHELPNDRESTERRMHEMTIVLKAVASAMLTGKNVIVMVKRQGHVAREFRVMETVVLAITPMDAASLALVCNALYKPALSLAFPEDEVWPLLVTYSDLLAQAKVEDEQIVEVLRQCASERLMSLQGGDAATDLAAFKGRNHLKQWVNDVRHTLAEPNPAARLQMFSSLGVVHYCSPAKTNSDRWSLNLWRTLSNCASFACLVRSSWSDLWRSSTRRTTMRPACYTSRREPGSKVPSPPPLVRRLKLRSTTPTDFRRCCGNCAQPSIRAFR